MKKSVLAVAALCLAVSAAGCTTNDPTPPGSGVSTADNAMGGDDEHAGDDGHGEGGDPREDESHSSETAAATDPVCEEVFAGRVPLAERAENDRALIEDADTLEVAEYGEINLLDQRLDSAAEETTEERRELLKRINAPFQAISDAVQQNGAQDPETKVVTLADDLDLDLADSVAAQEELQASCQG